MMVPDISENSGCPRDEIASYIDGELSYSQDAAFDEHLSTCAVCRTEVKHQKQFLLALNASLEGERDIELPKDFTRRIVAHAEGRVSGLRRSGERFTALFVCTLLLLFAVFAIAGDTNSIVSPIIGVAEKLFAIGAFMVRFVFHVSMSIAVVARSLFSHVSLSWFLTLPLIVVSLTALFVSFGPLFATTIYRQFKTFNRDILNRSKP